MKETIRHDLRHVLFMGISTGGNALLGFSVGIILVRALSAEEYGLFSAAAAVMLVAQEFVGRGINDAMVRLGTDAAAGSTTRIVDVFRAGLALKFFFSLALMLVFFCTPRATLLIFGYPQLQQAIPAMIIATLGFGIWSFILTWHQARMTFGRLALIQPIYNLLRIGFYLIMMFAFTLQWVSAIWIMAAAFFVAIFFSGTEPWRTLAQPFFCRADFRQALTDLWRFSGWGMLAALAFVTLSRMDIFILTRHDTAQEVAIYNAGWQLMTILDLAVATILTVMTPKVAHCKYFEEMLQWSKRTFALCLLTATLSFPLFLLADWYVPLFLGIGYMRSIPLVKIIYCGNIIALLSFPFVGILFARKKYHLIALIQLLLLAASVPAYTFAASSAGITGVAWATFGLRAANAILIFTCVILLLKHAPHKLSPVGCEAS